MSSGPQQEHLVCSVKDVEDHPQVATVNDRKFIVVLTGDDIYAYQNICPHQGGPIAEGRVDTENCKIICPWHGWEFNFEEGENPYDTKIGKRLPQAPTVVRDEQVYIVD